MTRIIDDASAIGNRTAAWRLALVWLVAFPVALAIPTVLYVIDWISPESVTNAWKVLAGAYAPYVGVVLAFLYRHRNESDVALERSIVPRVVRTALVTSVGWNVIVIGVLLLTVIDPGKWPFDPQLTMASELSSYVSWAVAPAMGFFFGGAPARSARI
jgi:hypothetical protein